MITLWILLLPAFGALAAWLAGRVAPGAARLVAAAALAINAVLLLSLWPRAGDSTWIAEWSAEWIPALGIRFSLGLDGLSLLLSLMACGAAFAAVVSTPHRSSDEGTHCALLLLTITGVLGVFLATDLMLFFVFYEIMLVPAIALIVRWGSGDSRRAAMRFFVFTQTGGLLMLTAIIGLHVDYLDLTGVRTFDYSELRSTTLTGPVATLFALCFALAFAVKLPVVPVHVWQPDAYASARVETAIVLSALMSKTAGYGLLRFVVPTFPEAAAVLAPAAIAMGVLTIVYTSWLAYGQRDIKRLIAYSSAGHLGYVVLGVFAMNDLARSGAILQLFCHGLSVTGLFIVADHIERRTGTRDLDQLGGLWHTAPRLGGIGMVFALATLGLPGLGNFIGEFLVLAGLFQANPVAGAIAAVGAVLSAAYSLRLMQRIFFGPRRSAVVTPDLPFRAAVICGVLIATLVWAGVRPGILLDAVTPAPVQTSDAEGPR